MDGTNRLGGTEMLCPRAAARPKTQVETIKGRKR